MRYPTCRICTSWSLFHLISPYISVIRLSVTRSQSWSLLSHLVSLLCHLSPSCLRTRGPINCIDIDVRLSCRCCLRRVLLTFSLRRLSLYLSLICPVSVAPPVPPCFHSVSSFAFCRYLFSILCEPFGRTFPLFYFLFISSPGRPSVLVSPSRQRGPLSSPASHDPSSLWNS